MKRGQFAVEYLTTYGWVILSIVIALSALSYFGVLSPSKYVPDRCRFGYQFICEDYKLRKKQSGTVKLDFKLRNNFGRTINITKVKGIDSKRNVTNCDAPTAIQPGEIGEFKCTVKGTLLTGNKYSMPARIYFHRNASGAPTHSVAGEIYTTVRAAN